MTTLFVKIMGTMDHYKGPLHEQIPLIGVVVSETTLIGSRPLYKHAIVIQQPGVSRRHARLSFKEGHWFLQDLLSDNGIWLLKQQKPDQRLEGPHIIVQDMTVLLGTVVLQFDVSLDHASLSTAI